MLYWKDDIDMNKCKFCGDASYMSIKEQDPSRKKSSYAVFRYLPLTHRLQRFYALAAIVEHVTWDAIHQMEEGSMCHSSDVEAWRHFGYKYFDFILEPCNVRLGLCIDGFAPKGSMANDLKHGEQTYLAALIEIKSDVVQEVPNKVDELLDEFRDVFPPELPKKLPPRLVYRMSSVELVELRKQLDGFLEARLIQPSKGAVWFPRSIPKEARWFEKDVC
ncbi:UNVERIFIED_CONTAM: hypothetical protein Slati_3044400 [Sesamum latifolium]|uniref:Uncharacterized protein n=1 Tax=Sesamum latifolium TaxID=2727402 RepID=A0AAW2UTL5_9LAMI